MQDVLGDNLNKGMIAGDKIAAFMTAGDQRRCPATAAHRLEQSGRVCFVDTVDRNTKQGDGGTSGR
jgi:hypothetical protein